MRIPPSRIAMTLSLLTALTGCSMSARPELNVRASASGVPQDGRSGLEKGREMLALGQNALAIEAFREEVRFRPESADAYNGMAIAYDRIGRPDLAKRYFETALGKAPENDRFRTNLAQFLSKSGRLDQANILLSSAPTKEIPPPETFVSQDQIALIELLPKDAQAPAPTNNFSLHTTQPDVAELQERGHVSNLAVSMAQADISLAQPTKSSVNGLTVAIAAKPMTTALKAASSGILAPHAPTKPARRNDEALIAVEIGRATRKQGAYLERMSLGEVFLITHRETTSPLRRVARNDFDSFGARLQTWLPSAMITERGHNPDPTLSRAAIAEATLRAKIEVAIGETTDAPGAKLSQASFEYVVFDGNDPVRTRIAGL